MASPILGYRCSGCRRFLTRRECRIDDDPMAPFGPERVCPYCDSLVTFYVHPLVVGLAVVTVVLLGFAAGYWLDR